MKQIKIATCDSELLFRKGLAMMLGAQPDMDIVLSAGTGDNLIQKLRETKEWPDLLFIDVKVGNMTGPHCIKRINEEFPDHKLKIIILSNQYTPSFIMHMLEKGVASYLNKNCLPEDLFYVTRKVYLQGSYYTSDLIRIIQDNISKPVRAPIFFNSEKITRREKEILELICQEYSSHEIAEKLFISPRTVEGHRNKLMEKTNSKNTVGLVMYAIANRFIRPEEKLTKSLVS